MKQTLTLPTFVLSTLFVAIILFVGWLGIRPAEGSVAIGNAYSATSTAPSKVYGAQTNTSQNILSGSGTLGSVVITGANTGIINFWDATTTNSSLRTGQVATSSLTLLASIPASTVAGTYTLDVEFKTGLVYDVYSGIMPTTTITFRRN